MQLRPDIQIQTIIKALMEDIIPALDQSNQLAMQSAQLAIGTLSLMAQHLPLAYRYDCDELARLVETAENLKAQSVEGAEGALAQLESATTDAKDVLDRAKADPSELLSAIRALREASGDLVRSVYEAGSEEAIAKTESTILASSKEQLLRDRSWLLMQGWEPNPEAVPAIDTLLPVVAQKK